MATIKELREKRVKLYEDMKNFLDSHEKNGVLNAEDSENYAKMEADFDALTESINRQEKIANIENNLQRATSTPLVSDFGHSVVNGRGSKEYKESFWNIIRGRATNSTQTIGTDANGGYLVPDEFENQIITELANDNVMRQICKVIKTGSGEHKIPVVASQGAAEWTGEEAPYNESGDTFTQVILNAYKLTRILKVSEELLNDSAFNLETYLAESFAHSFSMAEEAAFINGTGNKPTGFLSDAKVGGTTTFANEISGDEVLDLYFSVKTPYRKNGVFLMSSSAQKAIRKAKDNNGQYLWHPGLNGESDTLMGKTIKTSDEMPELEANSTSLAFGDFSYYWIADRQGITFKRLNEKYAENGQVGFLASKRTDGKLILPSAISVLKQGTEVSAE